MSAIDLTPFWCLVTEDEDGGRMYAYGKADSCAQVEAKDVNIYRPYDEMGALSHRPREARKFASEAEALAALPALTPWIEQYVQKRKEDRRRYSKDQPEFQVTLPLRAFFEDDLIAIYGDGSGLARDEWRTAMKWLERRTETMRVLRAFATKYRETLAGMSWRLDDWSTETKGATVILSGRNYRGERVKAEEIAGLFPAEWTRQKELYPRDGYVDYHWLAKLDDVTLLIEKAESYALRPVDAGRSGTKVKIARPKKSEVAA